MENKRTNNIVWYIIGLLCILGLLCSCSMQYRLKKYCPLCPQKDSIVKVVKVTETLKDTVIKIKADSSVIESLLACDSLGNVYIKNINDLKLGLLAKPKIILKDNIIRLTCKVDTQAILMRCKERTIIDSTNISKTKIVTVNVKKWYETLFIYSGILFWIIVIIYVLGAIFLTKLKTYIL